MKNMEFSSRSSWWAEGLTRQQQISVETKGCFANALAETGLSLVVASRSGSVLTSLSIGNDSERCLATINKMAGPMGMDLRGPSLAVGTALGIRIFHNVTYGSEVGTFVPVSMQVTSAVSIHDVAWGSADDLWFVNTLFSALCVTDRDSHFKIRWRPFFVTNSGPDDCCHLNGMAMDGGVPRFVTSLSMAGTKLGWRATVPDSGVLMDVGQEVVRAELSLPHSPKMLDKHVWLLESGKGRLVHISTMQGDATVISEIPGVLRGLAIAGGYAFVGVSRIRQSSAYVAEVLQSRFTGPDNCRVYAVSIATGVVIGYAELPFVDEISSVHAIACRRFSIVEPNLGQMVSTYAYKG